MKASLLKEYPAVISVPVQWADMDAFGHVNNTIYLRWFESARISYFEQMGFYEYREREGVGPILGSTQCKFLLPLTYPDTAWVGATVNEIGDDRFKMQYAVASERHRKLAAVGEGLIVSYDYHELRKASLPDSMIERIRHIEKAVEGSEK